MSNKLAGKSILIVDEDAGARGTVRVELAAQGAGVVEAPDCQIALEIARGMVIDAVIADLRLPGGNALELFASLSLACAEVPLFFLITGEKDISESEAKAFGVSSIFPKPLDAGVLVADVATRVGRLRSTDALRT